MSKSFTFQKNLKIQWKVLLALALICSMLVSFWPPMEAKAEDETITISIMGASFERQDGEDMLAEINAFRASEDAWYWNEDNTTKTICTDLKPLVYDYGLEQIAMQRALEIAFSFAHTRPNGTAYSTATYEGLRSWGENISYGSTTMNAAFLQWREDDANYKGQCHRRNMLETFDAIGIAHVKMNGYDYWVQEFGWTRSNKTRSDSTPTTVEFLAQNVNILSVTAEDVGLLVDESINLPIVDVTFKVSTQSPRLYENHGTVPVTWTSADQNIVKIENDQMVGVSAGQTTLTSTNVLNQNAAFNAYVSTTGTINVTYDPNGGTGTAAVYEKPFGEVQLIDCGFSKENYIFEGWNTQADGEGESYAVGDTLSLYVDTILYANWKPVPSTAQAIYTDGDKTLTFVNEVHVYSEGETYNGQTITEVFTGLTNTLSLTGGAPWDAYKESIRRVVFTPDFKDVKPQYLSQWFYNFTRLSSIVGLEYLNTSQAVSMSYLFFGCQSLTEIDISTFDTSNLQNISGVFGWCTRLETIYCKDADTDWSNFSSSRAVFENCPKLKGSYKDTTVNYNSEQAGENMAKSAKLGGYFTPISEKPVAPSVVDHSLTIGNGKIGVNFYVNPGSSSADQISVTLEHLNPEGSAAFASETTSLEGMTAESDGTYKVTMYVAAKEMEDVIQAKITVGGEEVEVTSYSVEDYYEAQNGKVDQNLQNLLDAMILYGESAQQFFNHNESSISHTSLQSNLSSVDKTACDSYKASTSGTLPEGVKVNGFTLILESDTTIRMYFDLPEGKTTDNYTFKIDGKEIEPQESTVGYGQYYLAVVGILPQNFALIHTFSVSDGTSTYEKSYGVLSYVCSMLNNSSDEDLTNLVKAIYLYHQAAVAY